MGGDSNGPDVAASRVLLSECFNVLVGMTKVLNAIESGSHDSPNVSMLDLPMAKALSLLALAAPLLSLVLCTGNVYLVLCMVLRSWSTPVHLTVVPGLDLM